MRRTAARPAYGTLAAAPPDALYRPGDRVRWGYPATGLLEGTVAESDALTFWVAWQFGAGRSRFTHGREPGDLRLLPDESPGQTDMVLFREITAILDRHPEVSAAVRREIAARRRTVRATERAA